MNNFKKTKLVIPVVRWVVRFGSLLSIGLIGMFLFGSNEPQQFPTRNELLGFAFFPIGIVLGMIAAWRWELAGGLTTLLSLIAFYVWHLTISGSVVSGPWFVILSSPGSAFLVLGATKPFQKKQS